MQKIICCGNLTADPVLNDREYTVKDTGEIIKTKVCNFTIACNNGYGDRKTTQFFRVNAWRGLGENCAKYLTKGRQVLVEGPIQLNNYVDKNNNLRTSIEIRADEIQFLGESKVSEPEENMDEVPY